MVGSSCVLTASRCVQSSAPSPPPIRRSAARYSSSVPNSACAMPTPHRMKYFHAASSAAGVRYTETSSTVQSVAASMATHSTPRLLVVSAHSIIARNNWYIA